MIKVMAVKPHSHSKNALQGLSRSEFDVHIHDKLVTLDVLGALQPDVIVFCDCAGRPGKFYDSEIEAMTNYVTWGNKAVMGTYLTFHYSEMHWASAVEYSNLGLMSLFGLENCITGPLTLLQPPVYEVEDAYINSSLFRGITLPFKSNGYSRSCVPMGRKAWGPQDILPGADVRFVAKTQDCSCVMLHYVAPTHNALYISTMIEFNAVPYKLEEDSRLFENAIRFVHMQNKVRSLSSMCVDKLAQTPLIWESDYLPEDVADRVCKARSIGVQCVCRRMPNHSMKKGFFKL